MSQPCIAHWTRCAMPESWIRTKQRWTGAFAAWRGHFAAGTVISRQAIAPWACSHAGTLAAPHTHCTRQALRQALAHSSPTERLPALPKPSWRRSFAARYLSDKQKVRGSVCPWGCCAVVAFAAAVGAAGGAIAHCEQHLDEFLRALLAQQAGRLSAELLAFLHPDPAVDYDAWLLLQAVNKAIMRAASHSGALQPAFAIASAEGLSAMAAPIEGCPPPICRPLLVRVMLNNSAAALPR